MQQRKHQKSTEQSSYYFINVELDTSLLGKHECSHSSVNIKSIAVHRARNNNVVSFKYLKNPIDCSFGQNFHVLAHENENLNYFSGLQIIPIQ